MTKDDGCTQVRIRKTTLANLKKIGEMGESYNDVIDRIIQERSNVPN